MSKRKTPLEIERTERLVVLVDADTIARLRAAANRGDLTVSQLVRKIIRAALTTSGGST